MNIEDVKELSFEEIREKYKNYLTSQGLSTNTISTAYSDSFYVWKKESQEAFWTVVLSEDFENEARNKITELLVKYSKADASKNVSGYVSHLRRFRDFLKALLAGKEFVMSDPMPQRKSRNAKTPADYEETIIIERMYAGGYLGDNIGHEIINTFRTDAGENYIYISPWGIINSKYQKTKAVLLVRLITEHCYEVIGYAGKLSLLLSQEAMKNQKVAGKVEDERQRKIIRENQIAYGGLHVNEIFSEQDNTVYATFKAEEYRNVKKDNPIYIVDALEHVRNENYIYIPNFNFSNQSLKLYAPEKERADAYKALDALIGNKSYWETDNTSTMIVNRKEQDSTFGILDVIGKNDDELVYSNWIGYYLKNYPAIAEKFASEILGVKLTGEKTEVKREYHNVDLWLEDNSNIVVIENKIKSGINGVDMDRHDLKSEKIQSQLSKYYDFSEKEAEEKHKVVSYYIFLPDYSYKDEDLSVYTKADKYKVIRYSQISKFFDELGDECLYIEEFRKALKKHSTPYHKDLYQVMEERFVNKINQKKVVC